MRQNGSRNLPLRIFSSSLAEEALFRGYPQRLSRIVHPVVALLMASVLFGLMHYSGGLLLIIFASLSGIIYGLAGCGAAGSGLQRYSILG